MTSAPTTPNDETEPKDELDEDYLALSESPNAPLWPVAVKAIASVIAVIILAYFASAVAIKDRYVVDFYPPKNKSKQPTLVIRWPSQQAQLKPIVLPASLAVDGSRWQAKQPKRATLRPDTILPAGEILEVNENPPPGRFLLQIGREKVEVSPDAEWIRR